MRILLHLSAGGGNIPSRLEGLTQEGIAAATFSGRSTVTKWLRRLEARDLVARERERIQAYPLPRYIYRLTEAGWTQAYALRDRLSKETVEVHSPSLGTLTVRMTDLPSLAGAGLDLTTAASMVKEGSIDLASIPCRPPTVSEPLIWGQALRQVDRLFGRSKELQLLDAWFASSFPILLVTGLPGIGKSTLVAGWIRLRKPPAHVFGFQIHRSTKTTALLADLGAFLAALGHRSLAGQLSQNGPPDSAVVGRILERDLSDLRVLLVIDSAEQMSGEVARFVRQQLLPLTKTTRTKLLLLSRRAPAWLGFGGRAPNHAGILQLRGLDRQSATALLLHRGFPADGSAIQDVVESTRGHPLLLKLVAQGWAGRVPAIRRYWEEEVWRTLSPSERRALEVASVFRRSVPPRILQAAARVHHRTLGQLEAKNLLERTVTGGYLVHDLIGEFVQARIGGVKAREARERAAEILLREQNPRDRWEGIYHLLAAGKLEEAAKHLDSGETSIADSVAADEIASNLRGLCLEDVPSYVGCVFSEILGDSLRSLGDIRPALLQYQSAVRKAEIGGQDARIPRILRKMAFIERCRNRYPRALGYLLEAKARIDKYSESAEKSEILRETALVEQALGKLGEAAAHLNQAVDLATEVSSWGTLSRALLALGSVESLRGYRERGLDYALEGLRIAEKTGNLTEVAHAEVVVGALLAELGRYADSLDHYTRGGEIARTLGNQRLAAYALMNRAAALLDLQRYKEAAGFLKEASEYFRTLEEKDTLALLKIYEGQWEMGQGRWSRAQRAWQEGIASLRALGSPVDLVRSLREVGTFHIAHGFVDAGLSFLREALATARGIGDHALASEIDATLASYEGALTLRKPSSSVA